MAMAQRSVVVGVFREPEQAHSAIDELRRAGYSDQEIGFLARAGVANPEADVSEGAATGLVSGGVLGGVLGAAAALLIPGFGPALAGGIIAATLGGAAIGATAGGLIGALTNMGISDSEARFYQKELEAGHTIVTVKASSDQDEAEAILQRNGAYDARTHEGLTNAVPPQRPFGTPPDTHDPTTGEEHSEPGPRA